jgi:preprotein translocase subunit Sec61beta
MVAWSFLGIRKNSESQEETARVNPLHVVVAGLAVAAVFVIGLILMVNWVLAK